jgi:hypothetical protein
MRREVWVAVRIQSRLQLPDCIDDRRQRLRSSCHPRRGASLIKSTRKHGPDVWQSRWSEKGPSGKRIYRKKAIGTINQYTDVAPHGEQ